MDIGPKGEMGVGRWKRTYIAGTAALAARTQHVIQDDPPVPVAVPAGVVVLLLADCILHHLHLHLLQAEGWGQEAWERKVGVAAQVWLNPTLAQAPLHPWPQLPPVTHCVGTQLTGTMST